MLICELDGSRVSGAVAGHSSGYPSFERKRRRRADLAKRKSAQVGGQR